MSLYGEVQKEVIQATLADDFGLDVTFRETTPIYVERPRPARARRSRSCTPRRIRFSRRSDCASSLRPRAPASTSGWRWSLARFRSTSTRRSRASSERMDRVRPPDAAGGSLRLAGHGLPRDDDQVQLQRRRTARRRGAGRSARPPTSASSRRSSLMQALERAGTVVCEPVVRVSVEVPTGAIGAVMAALARLGATVETPSLRGRPRADRDGAAGRPGQTSCSGSCRG